MLITEQEQINAKLYELNTDRSVKIFINDTDTTYETRKGIIKDWLAGTVSGYVQLRTPVNMEMLNQKQVTQLSINTVKTDTTCLGAWDDAFKGCLSSYRKVYKGLYENVTVVSGNLIYNDKGNTKIQGCFMAAFDSEIIRFQCHFPNGAIYQCTANDLVVNERGQRETYKTFSPLPREAAIALVKDTHMSKAKNKTRYRKGSKMSYADEAEALQMFIANVKTNKIAKHFDVAASHISRLKRRFIDKGLLYAL